MKYCLEHGLTAVHTNEPPYWGQYRSLAAEQKLPIRTFLAGYYTSRNCGDFPKPGEKHGERLSCDRIKIFADGALGSATAKMSLPYKGGDGKNYGVLIQSQVRYIAIRVHILYFLEYSMGLKFNPGQLNHPN